MTSINFVKDFDFSCCTFLHSGHLEQLAIAYPNLQRLNLFGKGECLRSLKGLAKVAQCCTNLCGLLYISLDKVEQPFLLWDILGAFFSSKKKQSRILRLEQLKWSNQP